MSSAFRFNFADNRLNMEDYQEGFQLAMKIKKGISPGKWSDWQKKQLCICCYTTITTHFLRFPHEEDYRVGRILRHLFNVRDRRPPNFIDRIRKTITEEEMGKLKSMAIPLTLALVRNTHVRPAHLPPIR